MPLSADFYVDMNQESVRRQFCAVVVGRHGVGWPNLVEVLLFLRPLCATSGLEQQSSHLYGWVDMFGHAPKASAGARSPLLGLVHQHWGLRQLGVTLQCVFDFFLRGGVDLPSDDVLLE